MAKGETPVRRGDMDPLEATVARVTSALRSAGFENADREARWLVESALGLDPISRQVARGMALNPAQQGRIEAVLARRLRHEPLSRIEGERAFYGRPFTITPATLDPRPDSETIIDAVKDLVRDEGWFGRPLRILDIGTGSGCLLVTLLAELEGATGTGTDIDPAALDAARSNALRHGVAARAEWIVARSLQGIRGPFDLVVSNPPYIRSSDIALLDPEVRDFDPHGALDGGVDGLAVYREIAQGLVGVVPRGWVIVEAGAGQAGDIAAVLRDGAGKRAEIRLWKDLGGHTRCVAARTQF